MASARSAGIALSVQIAFLALVFVLATHAVVLAVLWLRIPVASSPTTSWTFLLIPPIGSLVALIATFAGPRIRLRPVGRWLARAALSAVIVGYAALGAALLILGSVSEGAVLAVVFLVGPLGAIVGLVGLLGATRKPAARPAAA
jgi:hypothetical protein